MRQRGRGGRCRPRPPGSPGPEVCKCIPVFFPFVLDSRNMRSPGPVPPAACRGIRLRRVRDPFCSSSMTTVPRDAAVPMRLPISSSALRSAVGLFWHPHIRRGGATAGRQAAGRERGQVLRFREQSLLDDRRELHENLVRVTRQVRPQRVVTWSLEWNWKVRVAVTLSSRGWSGCADRDLSRRGQPVRPCLPARGTVDGPADVADQRPGQGS